MKNEDMKVINISRFGYFYLCDVCLDINLTFLIVLDDTN